MVFSHEEEEEEEEKHLVIACLLDLTSCKGKGIVLLGINFVSIYIVSCYNILPDLCGMIPFIFPYASFLSFRLRGILPLLLTIISPANSTFC
jgi:hypothetical protein